MNDILSEMTFKCQFEEIFIHKSKMELDCSKYSDIKSRKRREIFRQRRDVLFKSDFEKGRLTKYKYKMLHLSDQLDYLNSRIEFKYLNTGRNRKIGGYYDCQHCAESDLFENGDDVSEE